MDINVLNTTGVQRDIGYHQKDLKNLDIFQLPLTAKCERLTFIIDSNMEKDTRALYSEIIADVFGCDGHNTRWDIRCVTFKSNFYSYNTMLSFLRPDGPFFRLCYKLLDSNARFQFPVQQVSTIIWQKITNASPSFYKQLLGINYKPQPPFLLLNAFEYYFFKFAFHLVDPVVRCRSVDDHDWETLYVKLVELYLEIMAPCTQSVVHPVCNYVVTSSIALPTFSPPLDERKKRSIFRQDVLKKLNTSMCGRSRVSICEETWRTQLIINLFIDYWLVSGNGGQNEFQVVNQYYSIQYPKPSDNNQMELFPSLDHTRCVRLLLKHLHYFCNHSLQSDCPMNRLKRDIWPCHQITIYRFFRHSITEWPLDSSFRLLLEAWLSYIQPWRYTNPYSKRAEEMNGIDSKWTGFISENILFYSHLYFIVLNRLSRCDLITIKNSKMLYRLTKVFSEIHLVDYIIHAEMEGGLTECWPKMNSPPGLSYSTNPVVWQNICLMENEHFNYINFFNSDHLEMVNNFATHLHRQITSLKIVMNQEHSKGLSVTLKNRIKGLLLFANIDYYTTDDKKRILENLLDSLRQLIIIHRIEFNEDTSPERIQVIIASHSNNTDDSSFVDETSAVFADFTDGRNTSLLDSDPREQRMKALSMKYEGNPDLRPASNLENKLMVKVCHFLSNSINKKYGSELVRLYEDNSIVGGVSRLLLRAPEEYYTFEGDISGNGNTKRIVKRLPARLSLRPLASNSFLLYLLISFFVLLFLRLPFPLITVVILLILIVQLCINH